MYGSFLNGVCTLIEVAKMNLYKRLLLISLCLIMSLCMISCGIFSDKDDGSAGSSGSASESSDTDEDFEDPTEVDYDNGIVFEEEGDEAVVRLIKTDPAKFVGKWEATSGQSLYQYGNVDITVKANGTWKGNISEEELSGKWVQHDKGIYLTSDLFNIQLDYTDEDVMIMSYQPDPEDDPTYVIRTVLTRK